MSRKRFSPRVSFASASRDSSSRSRYLDTPLWLLLYWIDLSIVSSGFIRRRSLLRLRNQILSFLDMPSGDIWEVHVKSNKKGYRNA